MESISRRRFFTGVSAALAAAALPGVGTASAATLDRALAVSAALWAAVLLAMR